MDGFIKVAETQKSIGELINIGSSMEISIEALTQKIFGLLGRQPEVVVEDKRIRPELSEVERLMANIEKAKKLLNWSPRISLNEGLDRTIVWIEKNLSFYHIDSYHI